MNKLVKIIILLILLTIFGYYGVIKSYYYPINDKLNTYISISNLIISFILLLITIKILGKGKSHKNVNNNSKLDLKEISDFFTILIIFLIFISIGFMINLPFLKSEEVIETTVIGIDKVPKGYRKLILDFEFKKGEKLVIIPPQLNFENEDKFDEFMKYKLEDKVMITVGKDYFNRNRISDIKKKYNVIFEDNFNTLNSEWGNEVGEWVIKDGSYFSSDLSKEFNFSLIGNLEWKNYIIDFKLKDFYDGGILVHSQDTENAIALIIRPQNKDIYWHILKNNKWGKKFNSKKVKFYPQYIDQLRLVVKDNSYRFYWFDELISSFKSDEFEYGKAGVYSYSKVGLGKNLFDEIKVTIID